MTFDDAFNRTFGIEGGYVNDPSDPGGETNWGISKREYPDLDIKNLTRDEAKAIYLRDYWSKLPSLPFAIAYQVFDFSVNSGIGTALRALQRAIGVADDGQWGPVSGAALGKMLPLDVIMLLNAERLVFMTKLSNWLADGRGWARRVATNLTYAATDQE